MMRCTSLLGGLALLASAAAPYAASASKAAPAAVVVDAATRAAQRDRLTRHLALAALAMPNGVKDSPTLALLKRHQSTFAPDKPLLLAGKEARGLTLGDLGIVATGAPAPRRATVTELRAFRIDSPEALDRALTSRLLERAAEKGRPTAARVERARAKLESQIADAEALPKFGSSYRTGNEQTDARFRMLHMNALYYPPHPGLVTPQIPLAQDPSGVMLVHDNKLGMTLFDGTAHRPVRYVDLAKRGLGTEAAMHLQVAHQVVAVAGIKGSATEPRALRRADRLLRARINRLGVLGELARVPLKHPDLSLLHEFRAELAKNGSMTPLVLAESDHERLIVKPNGTVVVTHAGPDAGKSHSAGAMDLVRLGITSRIAFDQAVGRAMMDIAPEDLE